MKIYYEISDELEPELPDNFYHEILNAIPEPIREGLRPAIEGYLTLNKKLVVANYESWKYKIMWKLRSIESEINSQEGCMIIKKDGKLELKDYSDDLKIKIAELLKP
jgi:hypothetical protein